MYALVSAAAITKIHQNPHTPCTRKRKPINLFNLNHQQHQPSEPANPLLPQSSTPSAPHFPNPTLSKMPSALGITKISHTNPTQILRLSPTDLPTLRTHLSSWGLPAETFTSYPLLLRALTHTSISNWAERTLNLRKRSLSPHALAMLGDRVVGCVASMHLHKTLRSSSQPTRPAAWGHGTPGLDALVGNRGMALTASRMHLPDLLRWERSEAPRHLRGLALTTTSNVEVNALAAAYEAVTAAIYLDGGFDHARLLVHHTLLSDPVGVASANARVRDHADGVLRALARRTEGAVWFSGAGVDTGRIGARDGRRSMKGGRVTVELLDLETGVVDPAQPRFYAGVVVRGAGEQRAARLGERDFLSVACHFSKEGVRIAALRQAVEMLEGEGARVGESGVKAGKGVGVEMRVVSGGEGSRAEDGGRTVGLSMRNGGDIWALQGDYGHFERVLQGAGLRVGELGEAGTRGSVDKGAGEGGDKTAVASRRRRGKTDWPMPIAENLPESVLCPSTIATQLSEGQAGLSTSSLHKTHPAIAGVVANADVMCHAIRQELAHVGSLHPTMQKAELKALHTMGHQVFRLWGVQRSMRDVSQDRTEIVMGCERRAGLRGVLERDMVAGNWGISDGRLFRIFLGLGVTLTRFGPATGLAWLSGAEEGLRVGETQLREVA